MHAVPLGKLIGYKADHGRALFPFQFNHTPQCIFHRNTFPTKLVSQLQKESIHGLIIQRMVNLRTMDRRRYGIGQRCHPLPITIMPKIKEYEIMPPLAHSLFHLLHSVKYHPLPHFLFRDGSQLQSFHKIIAKKVIKFLFYPDEFIQWLFRKDFNKLSLTTSRRYLMQ